MTKLTGTEMAAVLLCIVAAINWGLMGVFNFNLVNLLFSWSPMVEKLVYAVIGLAGLWVFSFGQKLRKE